MSFELGPVDKDFEGSGVQFVQIKGGSIPKEFIPAIEKGFKECMSNGVLAVFTLSPWVRKSFTSTWWSSAMSTPVSRPPPVT
jgi:hypothetical protein